jgi:hypothetical protein
LDPQNEKATSLLNDIRYSVPEAVQEEDDSYILLLLTATPTFAPTVTDTPNPTSMPTSTITKAPTLHPTYTRKPEKPTSTTGLPTETISPTQPAVRSKPFLPVCSAVLLLPLSSFFWSLKRLFIGRPSVDKKHTS